MTHLQWTRLVGRALAEDIGRGDLTTRALFARPARADAVIRAKQSGVVAGLEVARAVFLRHDPTLRFSPVLRDGRRIRRGTALARIQGDGRSILTAERTALNFLQHLCGIATLTALFVERVNGYPVMILDTRKTVPGLRRLEKSAVLAGGGRNHRLGLFDGVLIKDNHIALCGSIREAIRRATSTLPARRMIQVEAGTLAQVKAAIEGGADAVLLDNMTIAQLKRAVKIIDGRLFAEASGGITLDTVRRIAATGVNAVSIGALTHSAPALDIHLEVVKR